MPCGMNYFHAHKFRSRAVVEFGSPVEVPRELVELYKSGDRREATRQLLDTIYQALVAVTVTSPDYDTLMVRWTLAACLLIPAHPGGSSTVQAHGQKASPPHDCGAESSIGARLHPLQGRSANYEPQKIRDSLQ